MKGNLPTRRQKERPQQRGVRVPITKNKSQHNLAMSRERMLHRLSSLMTSPCTSFLYMTIFAAAILASHTAAQEVGIDICFCSPSVYRWIFDFSLTCEESNITGGGLTFTDCSISTFGVNESNLVPVKVTNIDVIEFDQAGNLLDQQSNTLDITSGDLYTYISPSAVNTVNPMNATKSLEVTAMGVNSAGDTLFMIWNLVFSNSCDNNAYPIITPGQNIGWMKITSVEPPDSSTCPAAGGTDRPPPTTAPVSASPTWHPTTTTVVNPIPSPTTSLSTSRPTGSPSQYGKFHGYYNSGKGYADDYKVVHKSSKKKQPKVSGKGYGFHEGSKKKSKVTHEDYDKFYNFHSKTKGSKASSKGKKTGKSHEDGYYNNEDRDRNSIKSPELKGKKHSVRRDMDHHKTAGIVKSSQNNGDFKLQILSNSFQRNPTKQKRTHIVRNDAGVEQDVILSPLGNPPKINSEVENSPSTPSETIAKKSFLVSNSDTNTSTSSAYATTFSAASIVLCGLTLLGVAVMIFSRRKPEKQKRMEMNLNTWGED